ASRPPLADARFAVVSHENAVNAVLGGLQARPRELTNVVDIAYTAFDPDLAQRVADASAESFQRLNAESAQQASKRRSLLLEEQLRSTDSLLAAAQYQLSEFRKNVNAFSPREKFKSTEEGLAGMRLRREDLAQERRLYDQMYRALSGASEREGNEQM